MSLTVPTLTLLSLALPPALWAEHAQLGELVLKRDRALHERLRVVGHRDHRVLFQESVDPTTGIEYAGELQIGLGDRPQLPLGPVLVGVPVVVGQAQQQEIEQVVLDHVGAHAAGVAVAHPRHAKPGVAAGGPRGEDVGVEQLARTHHRMTHQARGETRQSGVALGLVAMAATVHQVRGPGRAYIHVVERLEHGQRVRRQVRAVHVVDRVGQLARDPEALGGAKAGAVLDVAVLLAVKPVHARDQVLVLGDAGDDRGGAHGGDRRKRGHAVRDVTPALDQRREHRRDPLGNGALEHRRRHRVDYAEDELGWASHRPRMRRPAYFSPARRRVRRSSTASRISST
jgi:hypothetical protein